MSGLRRSSLCPFDTSTTLGLGVIHKKLTATLGAPIHRTAKGAQYPEPLVEFPAVRELAFGPIRCPPKVNHGATLNVFATLTS